MARSSIDTLGADQGCIPGATGGPGSGSGSVNAWTPAWQDPAEAVREVCRLKFDAAGSLGWSPRMRRRFGYFTPDEWYEASLLRLVGSGTDWLDVGCGRDLFPSNKPLAALLSSRARTLVGLDPSDNIEMNELVHERAKCMLEEYETDRRFDVISLRMVAEHIADPTSAVAALGRLTRTAGRVVVYTVSKWSPVSLVAAATPLAVHHALKGALWKVSPEDTFPTTYHMNTRKALRQLFMAGGFVEESFRYMDDCRGMSWSPLTMMLELSAWRTLRAIGLRYPEICLLGIYRKGHTD